MFIGINISARNSLNTMESDIFTLPSSEEMRQLVLNTKEPTVMRNVVSDWDIMKWSLDDWSSVLNNKKLPFRIGSKKCCKEPQWERTCRSEDLTIEEFTLKINNGCTEWMYFDYKYMNQWFKDNILNTVSWKRFGFPEVKGEQSTFWLGSEGAHTPCHFDSYSMNIVAQVYGKKMWVLFPPDEIDKLKPTRVPYEESSVYSKINFYCGNSDYKDLKEAFFVILNPGDILFVPNRWWHYVENLTTAISINTWIPLESDNEKRLEESLVRNFISMSIRNLPSRERKKILNPNEDDLNEVDGNELLTQLSWCIAQHKRKVLSHVKETGISTIKEAEISKKFFANVSKITIDELRRKILEKCGCEKSHSADNSSLKSDSSEKGLDALINAFCHPEVIAKVKEKLLYQ